MTARELIVLLETVDGDMHVCMTVENDINDASHVLDVDGATENCGKENTIVLIPGSGHWIV